MPPTSEVPYVIREEGRLVVHWPDGLAEVPIDEAALRLLVDLANEGLRHG